MTDDATLARLRAERDAAQEEIAFLNEQLRSVTAYHTFLLDQERARVLTERHALLSELTLLGEELKRRSNEELIADDSADGTEREPSVARDAAR